MRLVIAESAGLMLLLAAALFVPAGRLDWPMAWAFLAVFLAFVLAGLTVFPEPLLEERASLSAFDSASDLALGIAFALLLYPGTLLVCGLDARFGWTPPISRGVQALHLGVFAAGYAFAFWAMRENPFFSTAARLQRERGQRVVASGPYRLVRHPGYAGAIVAHLALPLALGSLVGLAPAGLGAALVALRTVGEDRMLRQGLAGYAEYAARVRWRLLPGVW